MSDVTYKIQFDEATRQKLRDVVEHYRKTTDIEKEVLKMYPLGDPGSKKKVMYQRALAFIHLTEVNQAMAINPDFAIFLLLLCLKNLPAVVGAQKLQEGPGG